MKRTGFDTMSPYAYPFYILKHPRDGFLELKANKKGSTTVVLITVLLWLFVELFYRSATGYDIYGYNIYHKYWEYIGHVNGGKKTSYVLKSPTYYNNFSKYSVVATNGKYRSALDTKGIAP